MTDIHHEHESKRTNGPVLGRYAISRLAGAIEQAIINDRSLVFAIGDYGALVVTSAIVAGVGSTGRSTTLAAIDQLVVPAGIATSRRVRALVDWLEAGGAIERFALSSDRRSRPFRLTGWLHARLCHLTSALAAALGDDAGCLPCAGEPLLHRFAEHIVANVRAGNVIRPDLAWLIEARTGYLLLLRLIGDARDGGCGRRVVNLSRKDMARRSGVSRAHLTALLARMESRGWLQRTPTDIVVLDPGFEAGCAALLRDHLRGLSGLLAE